MNRNENETVPEDENGRNQADDLTISDSDRSWILSSLEHDQLVKARKHNIARRHLNGPALLVLWTLRIYLLFMMAVVAYQAWIGTR